MDRHTKQVRRETVFGIVLVLLLGLAAFGAWRLHWIVGALVTPPLLAGVIAIGLGWQLGIREIRDHRKAEAQDLAAYCVHEEITQVDPDPVMLKSHEAIS
jgi:hypothetical protein